MTEFLRNENFGLSRHKHVKEHDILSLIVDNKMQT